MNGGPTEGRGMDQLDPVLSRFLQTPAEPLIPLVFLDSQLQDTLSVSITLTLFLYYVLFVITHHSF